MNWIEIMLSPLLALVIGIFFLGLSRKILARIHWRYGPPLTQPVIDIIKLFSQKSVTHGSLFKLGIILSLAGSMVVVLFLPLGPICPLSGSGGMLVILYLILLGPLGLALGGGQAGNPNTSIGISRKLILALGYEVPLVLILLAVMTYYETLSIVNIVNAQQNAAWSLISLPLFLPGIAYILLLPAILEIRPFDLIQAPQEIASGPMVEYGGPFLALATVQHALSLFIGISLFVNLFLGGGANPVSFFLKMLGVFIIVFSATTVFPRLRVEQAVRYLWKWPALTAFLGVIAAQVLGS